MSCCTAPSPSTGARRLLRDPPEREVLRSGAEQVGLVPRTADPPDRPGTQRGGQLLVEVEPVQRDLDPARSARALHLERPTPVDADHPAPVAADLSAGPAQDSGLLRTPLQPGQHASPC